METDSVSFWEAVGAAEGVTFKNMPDNDGCPGFHAIDGDGNIIGGGYRNDFHDGYDFWLN